MRPDVSVCIATCRRPEGLARLLESLARQKLPPEVRVEVVVVDDAGDAPREAAGPGFPHPLRWIVAPRRNIALARNRAVEAARGRWLAFVDDDETADEGWLAAYLEARERDPVDGWFGPVLAELEGGDPHRIAPERWFARPRHATGSRVSASDLRTGNCFVRADLFDEHRFAASFGRTGGSDLELFSRLVRAGACFAWCDEARVTERVPAERHRPGWLLRRAFRGGVVHTRVGRAAGEGRAARDVVRAGLAGAALALVLPFALAFALVGGRAAALGVAMRLCVQAGHLWALTGRSPEEYGGPPAAPSEPGA